MSEDIADSQLPIADWNALPIADCRLEWR